MAATVTYSYIHQRHPDPAGITSTAELTSIGKDGHAGNGEFNGRQNADSILFKIVTRVTGSEDFAAVDLNCTRSSDSKASALADGAGRFPALTNGQAATAAELVMIRNALA